jgi:hypothetical protein
MVNLTEIDKQVYLFSFVFLFLSLFIYLALTSNVCFRQNIDADLGRVTAKVSSQVNPTASAKDTEKKKEKKKDKKHIREEPKEHKENVTRDTPVEVLNVDQPKDKKKKKKLKKTHSSSTSTAPDTSMPKEQPGSIQGTNNTELQGANNNIVQDVPQGKTPDHNNESSNSCLQPPPVKVFSSTFLFCKLDILLKPSFYNFVFYTLFRYLSQQSLRHLKKIKAKKFQSLSMHQKEMSIKRSPLQTRLPKAILKENSKIPLTSKHMTKRMKVRGRKTASLLNMVLLRKIKQIQL